MSKNIPRESPSPIRRWTGLLITALVALFLIADAAAKIVEVEPVLKASAALGLPPDTVVPIGGVLLACTVVYLVPATAVLGAVLLSAYLGGAVAIQVRVGGGAFPVGFSIAIALLAWAGLVLREPRLTWLFWVRRD